ncbi:Dam family site-specific DNA-(adenine-N6)-methyltransferase [Nisaea sp.]|uniref:DNA adenine methylase n=1 Tax=Nisaea sp. TaxID=2024842 RepID=UPI003297C0FE
MKPFIKWAGGKRWLTDHPDFEVPAFSGTYIEPFLGGGAMFFHVKPNKAILTDANKRLIEAYLAVRDNYQSVEKKLLKYQKLHSPDFYYKERSINRRTVSNRAAQFLYLNRSCWNGLYRENLNGVFNVPIGTKSKIIFEEEKFSEISNRLKNCEIMCSDFEKIIDRAKEQDLVFIDPPYTTAHNTNGFIKYNQNIFRWEDQIRLKNASLRAADRGAKIIITNADHESIHFLYNGIGKMETIPRKSVISGNKKGRQMTTETIYFINT